MKIIHTNLTLIILCLVFSCNSNSSKPNSTTSLVEEQLNLSKMQISGLLDTAIAIKKIPRTVKLNKEIRWTNSNFDWTEGFFPGTLWYLYEHTKDDKWKNGAQELQALFESHKHVTNNHDLGFVFNCSYGNGYRLTKNEAYKATLITAADSLLTRFSPKVGCIKSWNVDKGWQSKRNWQFPVIIDNMMNLELLFKVSEFTNDSKYKNAAIKHANTTLEHHFRQDYSSYHVVDYDPLTGTVRHKETAQGFSNESSWARGQAWGLYGFTICYRFTKDEKYLIQAKKIADYILNNAPEDLVPFWDYNAPNIPDEFKDVSAASITLSALIELDAYTQHAYFSKIEKLMYALSSNTYLAKHGENNNFILKHGVGSIPHNNEIDVPLAYADYYYVEALMRYKNAYSKN